MTYLLDTATCIGVLRQRPGMVQRLSQVSPIECAVSAVTVYELFCGVEKAQAPLTERQKVEQFLSVIAGHALANHLTVVTNNLGEFSRVTGLQVEAWP